MANPSGSLRAILYALGANLGIALAKSGAAFWTGSGAMLAEAIHSFADCANQVLLLIGMKRSQLPPSPLHPLGHGRAMYFWSLMVAILLFAVGGLISIYEGVERVLHPEPLRDPWLAVGILIFAIVLETLSLMGAMREIRKEPGYSRFAKWFRETRQSELMVVAGEDIAALLGLVFALIALLIAIATGDTRFDAAGSVAIGVLLVVVAYLIVREVKSLIIGESAAPSLHAEIDAYVRAQPDVAELLNLITLQWGNGVVVAVKARMRDHSSARELIDAVNVTEKAIREKFPQIAWLFFEPDVNR